jgi:hypothetical protein
MGFPESLEVKTSEKRQVRKNRKVFEAKRRVKHRYRSTLSYSYPPFRVARTMVASHPYSTMPLHVTIFTEEAKKLWDEASTSKKMPCLPPGLRVSVELEGVDGKSGNVGKGRKGPIDVEDGMDFVFSSAFKK